MKLPYQKVKRVKSKSKSALKRLADKLFSEQVRGIGFCQFEFAFPKVKCSQTLQCMHIIGRANHRLRWDRKNAVCGCSGHHMYFTSHPSEFYILIPEMFPTAWNYLLEHRNEMWDKDIQKVLDNLL